MALTKENLQQLIALQKRDAALDKIQAELDAIPPQIAAFKAQIDAEKARFAEAKTQGINLEKKKKEKELELASKEETAKKHSQQLNSVKTNEAFKALQKEIEQAKQEGGLIETEILEIMEAIDACRKVEKEAAAELKAGEEKAKREIASLEALQAETKARYDADKAGRDEAALPIDVAALKIYNHVRARGKPDAVVPIEDNNCSACRISLAPQIIVEAAKAKSLVACESCQRILYAAKTVLI